MCAGQSTQSPILMMRLVDETVSIVKPTRAVRVIINEKQDGTFLRPSRASPTFRNAFVFMIQIGIGNTAT